MKMKKLLVMSALAVVSTAFVACSSDDDLVQQAPVVPEENVNEGTPFSVLPSSGATRAVRYGSSAWDGTSDTYVNAFKIYGIQVGASTPWLNNVVFTRTAKDADWTPDRDATHDAFGDPENYPTWPKTTSTIDANVKTNFYAITDNAIGDGASANISGVTSWADGVLEYGLASKTDNNAFWYDNTEADVVQTSVTYVDPAKLKDLMYATTQKKESQTNNGQLPLSFHHALSGLTLKLNFLSNTEANTSPAVFARVYAVMVGGLNTRGTFTLDPTANSGAGSGEWDPTSLASSVCYYKKFDTPIDMPAINEKYHATDNPSGSSDAAIAAATQEVIAPGEWLVIPQTTTPWDYIYTGSILPNSSAAGYVALCIGDSNGTYYDDSDPLNNESANKVAHPEENVMILYYPLDTEFHPGKNRVITIDIAQGRCWDEDYDSDTYCDLHFNPATVITPGNP